MAITACYEWLDFSDRGRRDAGCAGGTGEDSEEGDGRKGGVRGEDDALPVHNLMQPRVQQRLWEAKKEPAWNGGERCSTVAVARTPSTFHLPPRWMPC